VEHSALVRCRDRLVQAGVKLGAYTNAANAQDLRDLREALGYAQWNVFGISYGTRLALSAARYDPQGIRSMILDSVYPPQANLFTSMPSSLDQALQTLYKGCAASPACQRAYPDLQGTFERLVARLDAQPVTIRLRDPRSGKRIAMVIDGSRMTEVVFRSLYRSELLPQLPKVIAATAKGVYGPLAELEAQRLKRMQGHSPAMYYAVECSTDLGGTTFEERSAAAAGFPQLASYFAGLQEFTPMSAGICDAWGIGPEQMEAPTALQSDIPTLLLAGEYDPITPASWAQLAAETLSRSEVYIFPGTGHAAITRGGCPRRMMAAFLDHFSAAEAGVCHSQFGGPAFAIK
jgi:pimeloyl-ACP methyl ester carboxylesterase